MTFAFELEMKNKGSVAVQFALLGLSENIDIASHMTNLSQTFIQGPR